MADPSAGKSPKPASNPASELPIRAIVGLGNPGKQYAATRHNVGFVAVERLAERLGASWSAKFNGNLARGRLYWPGGERDLLLLEPLQFMNLSGHATQAMAQFYGLKPAELLVIHDDLDQPFGKVQLKFGGGHGGHNGLRSISAQLGSGDYVRVRIGIGRPGSGEGGRGEAVGKGGEDAVSNWVLSPFGVSDRAELPLVIDRSVEMVEAAVRLGVRAAMNALNGPPPGAKPAAVQTAKGPQST